MDVVAALIVFLAIIVFLVLCILFLIAAVRHKPIKKYGKYLLITVGVFVVGVVVGVATSDKTPSKSEQAESSSIKVQHANELLRADTQVALKKYGIKDDTSKDQEDWHIAKQNKRYVVTVPTPKLKRVKAIFEWDGNKEHEQKLIYLLAGGKEYLNLLEE